jgi:hypothetical protein
MKKLISESEKNKIRKMNSIEEGWFTDAIDAIKNSDTFKSLKDKFKEITGIGSDDEETDKKESGEKVTKDYGKYKIEKPSDDDEKFYKKILERIDAPTTKENMAFFYAWRQAEGAKSTFNPFNTTQDMPDSTFWNCLKKNGEKCVGGVRNYKTEKDGIDATVKTLTNGKYDCIVNGLKKDKGAKEISKCSSLDVWGTKDGVLKVLDQGKITPPEISRSLVKKV